MPRQKKTSKKILLMEDDRLARMYFRRIFEQTKDLEIVAETMNGEEVMEYLQKHSVDMILLDLGVQNSGTNGLLIGPQLRAMLPQTPIFVISQYDCYYPNCQNWTNAYMVKEDAPEFLLPAVRELLDTGRGYISRRVVMPISPGEGDLLVEKLTEVERKIMTYTAHGLSAKDVAHKLGLSPHTIYNHLRRIYQKLKIPKQRRNQQEIVRIAVRAGMV